jgi:hypothetical protein
MASGEARLGEWTAYHPPGAYERTVIDTAFADENVTDVREHPWLGGTDTVLVNETALRQAREIPVRFEPGISPEESAFRRGLEDARLLARFNFPQPVVVVTLL